MREISGIFPAKLKLKKENQIKPKENQINENATFLDLNIKRQIVDFKQNFEIKETILMLL